MAGEIVRVFRVLAEDMAKAGKEATEKMEQTARQAVVAVRENAARAGKVDENAAKQITEAAKPVRMNSRGKVIPDSVERLPSGRLPSNWEYAGRTYDGKKWTPELAEKYPDGVHFTEDGYPDFSPYATHTVRFDPHFKGNTTSDMTDANRAAGIPEEPDGYVWHHHQDKQTMQLVPIEVHEAVRHAGGRAIMKGVE